ncbi:MAG: hypothetical protein A2203_09870 [Chromatiales bacterium RIFOXYA1_FULL_46_5]|nr:MAG: hypothetical protein A2203_09870 [Chromatiales bacterium RIFOXYA1_FULL_46_5]
MFRLLSLFFVVFSGALNAVSLSKVEDIVSRKMLNPDIPALAVSIISSGKIVHLSAKGFSDLDNQIHATVDTPFHVASVSKTVTNMVVFHMVQSGKIRLHENINNYLPFNVINPHHPKDQITVAELLNHLSGVLDNEDFYLPYWSNPQGDPKFGLEGFLKNYLVPGGRFYTQKNFEDADRYKVYDYSNTGYALLGLIVERVSGKTFDDYVNEYLFSPLGIKHSAFSLGYFDNKDVSKTYTSAEGKLRFKGFNGYPDYPAGLLRTSIADYSRLIAGYLNADKSPFPLTQKTTSLITPEIIDDKDRAYTWFVRKINDHRYYHHDGADLGARAEVIMDVKNRNAVMVFTNSETDLSSLIAEIEAAVFGQL